MLVVKPNKTSFKKGQTPWNKNKYGYSVLKNRGSKRNQETKNKMAAKKYRIILNVYTGIFYFGAEEAAKTMNLNPGTLRNKLNNNGTTNNTPFIYT